MYITEEHLNIRKAVRDFAEHEIKPIARELDEKGEFSVELTKKMGDLGLLAFILLRNMVEWKWTHFPISLQLKSSPG
jgi:alkylation response protein AidB-like acyl-CoA dehydrogenase